MSVTKCGYLKSDGVNGPDIFTFLKTVPDGSIVSINFLNRGDYHYAVKDHVSGPYTACYLRYLTERYRDVVRRNSHATTPEETTLSSKFASIANDIRNALIFEVLERPVLSVEYGINDSGILVIDITIPGAEFTAVGNLGRLWDWEGMLCTKSW